MPALLLPPKRGPSQVRTPSLATVFSTAAGTFLSVLPHIILDRQSISDIAGSASFFVWLFAQSPQILENYRRGSVDGLSGVFLAQWMLGDITNLIGCVLTRQLPFQVAIATYFCSIDFCIVVQYYYYWSKSTSAAAAIPEGPPSYLSQHGTGSPIVRRTYSRARTSSTGEERRSLSRTGSKASLDGAWKQHRVPQYHTFGPASGAAATLLEHRKRRSMFPEWRSSVKVSAGASTQNPSVPDMQAITAAADVKRGRDMSRTASRVASKSAATSEQQISSHTAYADRAHLAQEPDLPDVAEVSGIDPRIFQDQQASSSGSRVPSASPSRRSSVSTHLASASTPTSRRARSSRVKSLLALLACVTLFGIYKIAFSRHEEFRAVEQPRHVPSRVFGLKDARYPALLHYNSSPPAALFAADGNDAEPHTPHGNGHEPPSWERVIGRTSAWICTVLYMTSRLPQIWTNLTRRSVEGLSILLFFSAFMGNLLYTVSILVNPESTGAQAREYLAESIPFLLGSGGTLIFDLIIMAQWFAWKGNSPHPIAYVRRQARRTSSLTTRMGRSRSRSESMHSPAASHRVNFMTQSLPGLPSHPLHGEYGRTPMTPTLRRNTSASKMGFGDGKANWVVRTDGGQGPHSPESYFRSTPESEGARLLNESTQDRGDEHKL